MNKMTNDNISNNSYGNLYPQFMNVIYKKIYKKVIELWRIHTVELLPLCVVRWAGRDTDYLCIFANYFSSIKLYVDYGHVWIIIWALTYNEI